MKLEIRRLLTTVDERREETALRPDVPLRRIAAIAIVGNPYAGTYVEDLSEMIAASADVGELLARTAVEAMGGAFDIQSYGKGGVAGLGGELEHANAMLTTTFAEPLRGAVGGGLAWIPSFTKRAGPGAVIDVPLAHKDALYVRSHYDGMSLALPSDAPDADEVALIVCIANRGRLNARVGGLKGSDIQARDGLR